MSPLHHYRVQTQGPAGASSLQEGAVPDAHRPGQVHQRAHLQHGHLGRRNPAAAVPEPAGRHFLPCQDHRSHGAPLCPAGSCVSGCTPHPHSRNARHGEPAAPLVTPHSLLHINSANPSRCPLIQGFRISSSPLQTDSVGCCLSLQARSQHARIWEAFLQAFTMK